MYLHQQEGGVRCCDLKAPSTAKEAVTKVEEQGLTHRAQNTPSHVSLPKEMVELRRVQH